MTEIRNASGGAATPTTGYDQNPTIHEGDSVMYQSTNRRKERRDAILDGLSVVLGFILIIGLGWAFLTGAFGGAL